MKLDQNLAAMDSHSVREHFNNTMETEWKAYKSTIKLGMNLDMTQVNELDEEDKEENLTPRLREQEEEKGE